ncbi:MAG: acetolactate synthase small subunit [Paraprevotella sp.]|jgi:acetolactate synthase, small subunit|nr:acetolactate synthase small subunit [Paraprevotella sp.]MBP3470948.1 acetolactate synthase small subunit [Paraprevotella sp.]
MEQEKKLYTLLVFSENFAGLLNQVTAVFTRRQVNIESLNVSASSTKGVHKYTITCWSTEEQIDKITKQIEKKIDVLKADYFTDDDLFIQEVGLYKLSTPVVLENPDISRYIRKHGGRIVEVNPTYTIVSKKGMTDEIVALYDALLSYDCVLQYARSGRIAVTKSPVEYLDRYLEERKKVCEAQQQENTI